MPAVQLEAALYYLSKQGDSVSVDLTALSAAISSGEVDAQTLVWYEGMTDWMPLSLVPALASFLQAGGVKSSPTSADESISSRACRMNHTHTSRNYSSAEDGREQVCFLHQGKITRRKCQLLFAHCCVLDMLASSIDYMVNASGDRS